MTQRKSGPRRFHMCGIPFTYELILRIAILLITIGVLVFAAIPKIKSILEVANYVSVKITDKFQIPVPDILICGQLLDSVELDIVTRTQYTNGTEGTDVKEPVPTVKIVFACHAKENFTGEAPAGISMAIWNGDRDVTMLQPIWGAIPSINTLTFVYSEHKKLNSTTQPRYTLQKQNLRTLQFAAKQVFAKVEISPDSFFINQYIDNKAYTWVDLAGAIGGMASIALALWIFLFGSGRYKSWGIMQRYILQTSPNSKRYRKDKIPPKNGPESFKRWIKKLFSRLDSNADNDLDNMPLHPDPRRHSLRYSMTLNTAAAVASGGKNELGNKDNSGGFRSARSSVDIGNFYFSDHGAPGSRSLQPLAPINDNECSEEQEVEELIRLIDLRIDERMWSLEKTLSRYYLDGFRLRDYSNPYSLNTTAASMDGYQGSEMMTKDDVNKNDGDSPASSTNRHSRMEMLDSSGDYTPPMSSPPAPAYPPRPQINQHYAYVGENQSKTSLTETSSSAPSAGGLTPQIHIAEPLSPPPRLTPSEIEQRHATEHELSSGTTQHLPSAADGSPFLLDLPQRGNMRGTIRKAVERLQHEWPQSRAQNTYVPRTQYGVPSQQNQNRNNNTSTSNNNGHGSSGYSGYGNTQYNQQYIPGNQGWP
ncbi:hypothetical protein FBU30_009465 [Linnemannia zychae]|nr:hypothetical protein FBU30_009465 [Linnemannia zychae]